MRGAWERLRRCWTLPDASEDVRALLLNRQLRNLFRVVPWYVASNCYTGGGVLLVMWPFLDATLAWAWLACLVLVHLGWGWHAVRCARRQQRQGEQSLRHGDLYASMFWCALCALAAGAGIYLGAPLAASDASRLLLSAYTPGLIATGVLVGITTPLVSFTWLAILTISACLMVARLDFLAQGMTVTLLCCYAVMLSSALLFASHLFVRRIEAVGGVQHSHGQFGLVLVHHHGAAAQLQRQPAAMGIGRGCGRDGVGRQQARYGFAQAFGGHRLEQVVDRAVFEGAHAVLVVGAHEHDAWRRSVPAPQRGEAITAGQLDVQEQDVDPGTPGQGHQFVDVGAFGDDLHAGTGDLAQQPPQALPRQRLIVEDDGIQRHAPGPCTSAAGGTAVPGSGTCRRTR